MTNTNTRINPTRDLLIPNSGHYIVRSQNYTANPFNAKMLAEVHDQIDADYDETINTLEIILCRKIGSTRVSEKNMGFPLKFRQESRNSFANGQTNQTLVQFDDYNTKITRYLGHRQNSQMDDDEGLMLFLPNAETDNDILFYKFKTSIDIDLVIKMKWIIFPHEPIHDRVYLRAKMFNNDELYRNVPCIAQLARGERTPTVEPYPFSRIVPVFEVNCFPPIW